LQINKTKDVDAKFSEYPEAVKPKMDFLRKLVFDTAEEIGITEIEETLKWGEPSYLTKKGSTLRMDWKLKKPNQYAMYFKCTSKLVVSFKEVFRDTFHYETTRAIVFNLEDKVPVKELKKCIAATLNYHDIKDQPLLGLKLF